MASARTKLSREQLKRATRARCDLGGGRVVIAEAGDDEDVIHECTWEETSSDEWRDDAVQRIQEHAESLGPGLHRYVVRTYCAKGVQRASTWCRVQVARERAQDSVDDLDGSVGAYMAHLQRAYEEERRERRETLKMVSAMQGDMMRLVTSVIDRQHTIEVEAKRVREQERADLEQALKELAEREEKSGVGLGSELTALLAGPVLDKVLDRFEGELRPLVASVAKSFAGDAVDAAVDAVDATTTPELHS